MLYLREKKSGGSKVMPHHQYFMDPNLRKVEYSLKLIPCDCVACTYQLYHS